MTAGIQPVTGALVLSCAASVAGILSLLRKSRPLFRAAAACASGSFVLLTAAIAVRWAEAGHPPFAGIYETLLLLVWASWVVAAAFLIPRGMREPAALVPLLSVACLGYASTLDASIRPLFPALRSNWLAIHVAANMLGYAGFAAAFIAGAGLCVSLLRGRPSSAWERAAVDCIRFGLLFLTYGILTGAVWANEAWTTYWGWDPKEIWALLTWGFYFIPLALRSTGARAAARPSFAAFFAVGGFFFVLFTYFGVSSLLKGLHSYL